MVSIHLSILGFQCTDIVTCYFCYILKSILISIVVIILIKVVIYASTVKF